MEVDDEIQSNRKVERARLVAILDASLALSIFILCAFTFLFIHAVNQDDITPKGIYVILGVPFALNVLQLLSGILLLCLTRKNTRHLGKCRLWCLTANFLSLLIVLEVIFLLNWEFRTLALFLFGLQYLIRISAIRRLQLFMETLLERNPRPRTILTLGQGGGHFERVTQLSCAVPLQNQSTFIPNQLEWRVSITPPPWTPETPPPTYDDAIAIKIQEQSEPPPTYEEVGRQKARNQWRALVQHPRLHLLFPRTTPSQTFV